MHCPNTSIKEKDLKKQFGKEIKKITINDMVKELLTEAIKQSHEKEKELHKNGMREWQVMYDNAESRLNKLFELFYNGLINQKEFGERKREILIEKEKAREYMDSHGEAQKSWINYAEKLIITTNHAYKVFNEGNPEEVKLLLSAIGKNYVLEDGVLSFQFKEPFNIVAQYNTRKSSNKNDWLRGQDSNLQPSAYT